MIHAHPIAPAGRPPRGAASLIVVMVLFFIMALAGAYSSRSLIFEQRTSANQYRATQAIEAAEAGVEWALAMLNGGRIGTDCLEAGAAATATSFRQRYLTVLEDGRFRPAVDPLAAAPVAPPAPLPMPPPTPLMPSCVFNGTDWLCSCPVQGPPVMADPVGAGPFPAFRVRFSVYDSVLPNVASPVITQPGLVMVEVNGCTRADTSCLDFPGSPSDQEGRATVRVMVALKAALPTAPAAALTVRDNVSVVGPGGLIEIVNVDPESGGVTIQAGGVVDPAISLKSIPGSTGISFVQNDELLSDASPKSLKLAIPPMNANRVFASVFGTLPETYRQQPAAVPFECPVSNCRQALADLATRSPGRVIWIRNDLLLDSDGDIGTLPPTPADPTATGPVVLVVTGNIVASANVRIFGFVYSQPAAPAVAATWNAAAGTPEIQGAVFVESALNATGGGRIVFNRDVFQHLRYHAGSFVRVPGGWRDFQ